MCEQKKQQQPRRNPNTPNKHPQRHRRISAEVTAGAIQIVGGVRPPPKRDEPLPTGSEASAPQKAGGK
jgi:hypothetical protein